MTSLAVPARDYPTGAAARLPRYCTSLLNRIADAWWERRLGIRTTEGAASRHDDARDYGYLAYHTYFSIFDHLQLAPSDVVVDLGCGKGRVVCAAAQYPVREAVGVEIDPALCTLAEANGRRLRRRRAPVRFACQSAADFDFDPTSVLVMFHPFGAATLRDVLDRVHASLLRRPRRLRLVYCNPVLGAVVAERRWLRLENAWAPGRWSRIKFPVHFYAAG